MESPLHPEDITQMEQERIKRPKHIQLEKKVSWECMSVHMCVPFSRTQHTHTMTQNGGHHNYSVFKKPEETGRQVDFLFIYRRRVCTHMSATGISSSSSQCKITGTRQDPTVLHSYPAAACQGRDA